MAFRSKNRSKSGHKPITRKVLLQLKRPKPRNASSVLALSNITDFISNLKDQRRKDPEGCHFQDPYELELEILMYLMINLLNLDACSKLRDIYFNACAMYPLEDAHNYPVSKSYFRCWTYADLCIGREKETIADIAIAIAKYYNVSDEIIQRMAIISGSNMAFYAHRGSKDGIIELQNLITKEIRFVTSPTSYTGVIGQIWFARIFSAFGDDPYSHLSTDPYIMGGVFGSNDGSPAMLDHQLEPITEYISRVREELETEKELLRFLKFGKNQNYWYNFIVEAHSSTENGFRVLVGYPDIAISRPHSTETIEDLAEHLSFHQQQYKRALNNQK